MAGWDDAPIGPSITSLKALLALSQARHSFSLRPSIPRRLQAGFRTEYSVCIDNRKHGRTVSELSASFAEELTGWHMPRARWQCDGDARVPCMCCGVDSKQSKALSR